MLKHRLFPRPSIATSLAAAGVLLAAIATTGCATDKDDAAAESSTNESKREVAMLQVYSDYV